MRVLLFEDARVDQLAPIALMRPAYELRCGRLTLRERLAEWNVLTDWSCVIRPSLADVHQEDFPSVPVNDLEWLRAEVTLLINARYLPERGELDIATGENVGVIDGQVAWLLLHPEEAAVLGDDTFQADLEALARSRTPVSATGTLIERPWDLIDANPRWLAADFETAGNCAAELGPQVVVLGDREQVKIAEGAQVDPFVVLDARKGPIMIGRDAVVQSFTRLEGPVSVGDGSQIFRAHVHGGTTIGPVCRVGGEIEESILHGYANKYHEGFLGHSYVCPWVNLGALTTNSDLKNDYSAVRVPISGQPIDTGSMKVGCFIGDHTKTGLGSLFNTGSSIGVFSVVLPGGELLPKYVPSFSRVWHGRLADGWELDRLLDIARAAMARRNCELSPATERLVRLLAKQSQTRRGRAIRRDVQKRETQTQP